MNDCSYNIIGGDVMKKIYPDEKVISKMTDMLSIASDTTRLKIMLSLLDESKCLCECNEGHSHCGACEDHPCMIEKCVSEITTDVGASQSLISHQLKVLKDFDLVSTRRDGKKIYYSLKDGHVKQLISVVLEHALED